jgi:hypothetical protein
MIDGGNSRLHMYWYGRYSRERESSLLCTFFVLSPLSVSPDPPVLSCTVLYFLVLYCTVLYLYSVADGAR